MAKKKQLGKKHKFKYAAPPAAVIGADPVRSGGAEANLYVSPEKAKPLNTGRSVVVSERDFSYVTRDLRRIAILAVSLIALEIILWLTFGHTGLGSKVYSLVST